MSAHKMLMDIPLVYIHCFPSQGFPDQNDHKESDVVPWILWSFQLCVFFGIVFVFIEMTLVSGGLSDPQIPH